MPRSTIALLTFAAGALAAIGYSAHLGRKVWSPKAFAWRNPFKLQPIVEEQPGSPLRVVDARFYSFMSIGSSVGSVMKLDLKNISGKPIHSFFVSYSSPDSLDTGGAGIQPETLLQPGQTQTIGDSSRGRERVTFSVDFVQFTDGDTWFANPPTATVKPEGVRAGARAAIEYLREVLEVDGAAAVMSALPRIRSRMGLWKFSEEGDFGHFGFDYGIKKAVVSVEHAYQKDGISGVKKFLTVQQQ